jgi:hypothetical protein
MAFKVLCIIMVFVLLMEDSSSVRKKTREEEEEDEKMAEAVNATLAAEEEEKRKEDEEKKKQKNRLDQEKGEKKDTQKKNEMEGGQDEACLPTNFTCPVVTPCQPCKKCLDPVSCPDPVECDPCLPKDCKPCPRCEESEECPPLVCPPVLPCPADNDTRRGQELPTPPSCPELPSMTVPVALATGAIVNLLTVSAAAALGLVLRYVPPLISGFFFLVLILMVWFLSSRYPEVAREMGARAWTMMQEATSALSHRIVDALRHHNEQVGLPTILSLISKF